MENLPLAVHNLQLSVLLFYDQGQLRGKVPPLRPGSKELLIVLFLAAAADIERVVMTQRRSSRCEIIVLCLHCSTMTALGCGLELLAMYEIDVVGTLHGEFILVFQQTAEESFFDYGMQDLIDLLLFLDVLGLLQFALGQLLVRGVVVHGDALGIGRVDLALLLSLSNFHINQLTIHPQLISSIQRQGAFDWPIDRLCPLISFLKQYKSMGIKFLAVILIFLAIAMQGQSAVVYSPLRMCDSVSCDIQLNFINNVYNLTIPNAFIQQNPITTYCLRPRSVLNATNGTCDLTGFDSNYNCFLISKSSGSLTISNYPASPTLSAVNGSSPAVDLGIAQSPTTTTTNLTLDPNSIYEFVMGVTTYLSQDPNSKLVFLQTFNVPNSKSSVGNIFMQRYFQCYQYYVNADYNYNLIFYGGVLRDGQNVMYFSFVSFLSQTGYDVKTSSTLNIWGGLDFSTSHAGRDMVGFSSGYGYTYDLYSLFASSPYNDTSDNINSTMDYTQVFTSNSIGTLSYFIAVTGYRLYDTKDTIGDEIIRKKINYQFCYAVGYSTDTTPIEPTGSVKHNFVDCFTPNIVVWQAFLNRSLPVVLLILFIYSA